MVTSSHLLIGMKKNTRTLMAADAAVPSRAARDVAKVTALPAADFKQRPSHEGC
jgi:hypothetical protein